MDDVRGLMEREGLGHMAGLLYQASAKVNPTPHSLLPLPTSPSLSHCESHCRWGGVFRSLFATVWLMSHELSGAFLGGGGTRHMLWGLL